jgi:amphi-Trp domain-containing protein
MAEKQSFAYRGRLPNESAAAHLEALARGLREGHVTIEAGGELIESAVGDEVSLDLEAESSSKGRFTISLELDWRLRRGESVPMMLISSNPAPARSDPPAGDSMPGEPMSNEPSYSGYASSE